MHLLNRIRNMRVIRPGVDDLDKVLLVATCALVAIGLMAIFSATITENAGQSPWFFLFKQTIHAFLGAGIGTLVYMYVPLRWLRNNALYIALFSILILSFVHLPIVGIATVKGAARWINLGIITVQPVELTKIALIVYTCAYCAINRSKLTTIKGFARPLAIVFLADLILMTQPDFGSAVLITAMVLAILFMAGAKLMYFVVSGSALVSLAVVGILVAPYRMKRILSFSDPFSDPLGSGYHQTHSLMAFGKGGWFGSGLGQSVEKWSHLPEAHTDFIISVIAEETGVIGFALVLGLYAMIMARSFELSNVAEQSGRLFSSLLARAIGLLLIMQAFINIGGNLSLLPVKGLTLPLISYGGSSLIAWLVTFTLLHMLAHENNDKTVYYAQGSTTS